MPMQFSNAQDTFVALQTQDEFTTNDHILYFSCPAVYLFTPSQDDSSG